MSKISSLLAILENWQQKNILVVGDVMLDRFISGTVDRVSPEAPIPILKVTRENTMLGGAGNVARNIVSLGGACHFIALVGDDAVGNDVTRLAGQIKNFEPDLVVERGRPTTLKTRYVAGAQQLLRVDHETSAELSAKSAADVVTRFNDALVECDAVVLSDYAKGLLGRELIPTLIAAAKMAGKKVVIDPKGRDYRPYRGADLITPNRAELAAATMMPVDDDAAIRAAARMLMIECGVGAVMVTRSQQGLSIITPNDFFHCPAEAREVYDVSGAGDSVAAAVGLALAAGANLEQAAMLANMAGSVAVGKFGTAAVEADEMLAALNQRDLRWGENKIMSFNALLARVQQWRDQGLKIGFTNGCFDLLHPGHVQLLAQARAGCDRLVVAINSDDSVRRLKGELRPIQNQAARGAVLSSIASVDAVVVFDDDTPMNLIQSMRPDLLVKGADYTKDKVVGGSYVESYGGKVLLADIKDGHSTTSTVARINAKN